MMRRLRVLFAMIVLVWVAAICGLAQGAFATVGEDDGECWVPDVEFPVPCDEDDD